MTKKQAIRAAAFFLVLLALVMTVDSVFRMEKVGDVLGTNRRFRELYHDPEDTWDGVLLGTSVVDRAWAAPEAWGQYGMAVYPMSTDGQPFFLTVSLLEEVLRYQDVSFAVVDLHGIRLENLKVSSTEIRQITDQMRHSAHRVATVKRALEYMETWYPGHIAANAVSKLSYYLPILRYHTRLTDNTLYKEDLFPGETAMKGVYEVKPHAMSNPVELSPSDAYTELTDQQKELLDELLEFAEARDIALIFISTPGVLKEKQQGSINAAAKYVEERGCPVLNFSEEELLEDIGLDGETDFTDELHLNTVGARKFTDYLAAYLKEYLELKDHRGEEDYGSWDEALEAYGTFYEEARETILEDVRSRQ